MATKKQVYVVTAWGQSSYDEFVCGVFTTFDKAIRCVECDCESLTAGEAFASGARREMHTMCIETITTDTPIPDPSLSDARVVHTYTLEHGWSFRDVT